MTAAVALGERSPDIKASVVAAVWIGFAVLAVVSFALPDGTIPAWMREVPPPWRLGLDTAISSFMNWLVEDATFGLFTFREATRAISDFLNVPLKAATAIVSTGLLRGSGSTAVQLAPPLPWIAVVGIAAALGYRFGGARLALLAGGAFLYLAVFGQWASAMMTLASIAIAVPLGVAGGMLFGILGFSRSTGAPDHGADPRSHADGADLRLSHPDLVSVRLRAGVGADRDHDLCHASHGSRDHDRARGRAERDR